MDRTEIRELPNEVLKEMLTDEIVKTGDINEMVPPGGSVEDAAYEVASGMVEISRSSAEEMFVELRKVNS